MGRLEAVNGENGREPRFSQEQYDMLKRCSEKRDMTEWSTWRRANRWREEILLEGANLMRSHLEGASLMQAHMKGADLLYAHLERADLTQVHLEDANLWMAHLENADLQWAHLEGAYVILADLAGASLDHGSLNRARLDRCHLEGADLSDADLRGASLRLAAVDGSTLFRKCIVDNETDFTGVGLDSARVEPGLKQLLQYNIRRKRWREWYKDGAWWLRALKRAFVQPFWWVSDYGRSTGRIIGVFFGLAIVFAFVYWLCPGCVEVRGGELRGIVHAMYFSIVTMTTLGFGDIHASPDSPAGQVLLTVQVLLGYVLLAALVTRFAVLFTAGGPAGRFGKKKRAGGVETVAEHVAQPPRLGRTPDATHSRGRLCYIPATM